MTGKMFTIWVWFWVSWNLHGGLPPPVLTPTHSSQWVSGWPSLTLSQKAGSFSVTLISDCQILNECYAMSYSLWIKKKDLLLVVPVDVIGKTKTKTRHMCLYRLFKECINSRILLLLTLYDHTRFNQVCTNFSKSNHRTFNDRMMTKWSLADAAIFRQCLSIKLHCHNTIF